MTTTDILTRLYPTRRCPNCGSSQYYRHFENDWRRLLFRVAVWRCNKCGFAKFARKAA